METIIGSEFPKKVIPLIENAVKTIEIIVFDWRWYPQDPGASVQLFNQAIVRAVRRGVKVCALANNDEIIRTLRENGVDARRIKIKNLLHCKLILIDSGLVIIGSHNYTQMAFQSNLEVSVIFEDKLTADRLKIFFYNLWGV